MDSFVQVASVIHTLLASTRETARQEKLQCTNKSINKIRNFCIV